MTQPSTLSEAEAENGDENDILYALFMEIDTVDALRINSSDGRILHQIPVTGFHNFGEVRCGPPPQPMHRWVSGVTGRAIR